MILNFFFSKEGCHYIFWKFPKQIVKKPTKCCVAVKSMSYILSSWGIFFIHTELVSVSSSKEKPIFLESKSYYSQAITIKTI